MLHFLRRPRCSRQAVLGSSLRHCWAYNVKRDPHRKPDIAPECSTTSVNERSDEEPGHPPFPKRRGFSASQKTRVRPNTPATTASKTLLELAVCPADFIFDAAAISSRVRLRAASSAAMTTRDDLQPQGRWILILLHQPHPATSWKPPRTLILQKPPASQSLGARGTLNYLTGRAPRTPLQAWRRRFSAGAFSTARWRPGAAGCRC